MDAPKGAKFFEYENCKMGLTHLVDRKELTRMAVPLYFSFYLLRNNVVNLFHLHHFR
jgi:hypothetical protein